MAWHCPSCNRVNDDHARFCGGCGAARASLCAACGATLSADAEFCTSCGAPILVSPPEEHPGSTTTYSPTDVVHGGVVLPGTPHGSLHATTRPPHKNARVTALLVTIIVIFAAAAAAFFFLFLQPEDKGVGGTPAPVASSTGATPVPGAHGFLAAAVGHQGNVLGAVGEDGTVKELATALGKQIFHIAYSPDGRRIAVIAGSWKLPQLSLVDVTAGDTVKKVGISSPDVVAIDSVAWVGPETLLVAGFTSPPKNQGEDAELLLYDAARGEVQRPLTDAGGVALRGVSVSASADGHRIAYVTYTDQKTDEYGNAAATELLNVLDVASGTVTELGTNEAMFDVNARRFDDPLISPNGEAIIFRRAGSDVGTSYTVMDTNGVTLMPARELLFPTGYAWDPEGTRVVFTGQPVSGSGTGKDPVAFYLFDTRVGGSARVIAKYKNTMVQDLAWSPNGEAIAWAEWDTGEYRSGNMFLMSTLGGDSQRLADGAIMPAWAPEATVTSLQSD